MRDCHQGGVVLVQGRQCDGDWLRGSIEQLPGARFGRLSNTLSALLLPQASVHDVWDVLMVVKQRAPKGISLGSATWPTQASSALDVMAEAAAALAEASKEAVANIEVELEIDGHYGYFEPAGDLLSA